MTAHGLALARIALVDSLLAALIEELPRVQRRAVLAGIVLDDTAVVLDACADRGWRRRLRVALGLGRLAHSPRKEG